MADLEPDFQVAVWKYTYAEGSGADTIFLYSPQEFVDQENGSLVLRQINSDAENKVWIQEQASVQFRRCDKDSLEQLMDDAHGVIVRDGQAKTLTRQNEEPSFHRYKRGDRIWVERSLVPTHDIRKDENKIPVIDLESFVLYWIPFEYVCFVPQFSKKDLSGDHLAASPGAVLNTFQGKRKSKARIYFHWPASKPEDVSHMWLDKKNKDDLKTMKSFNNLQPLETRRNAFRQQWEALTKKLARSGLLLGDEIVEVDADQFESSSDSTDDDLALHWNTGDTTLENCCNLDPCPSQNDPDLDLVPSYVGGLRWVEHYHVQDNDLDECSQGAGHKKHCVLRDNKTRCAYDSDRVRHTCCKLRTNPLLPGPYGDPDDFSLPLWETTVGNEYFVDASRNVQTRRELEDRDDVPPEMHRLRQQMLANTDAVQEQYTQQATPQEELPLDILEMGMMMRLPMPQSMQQPAQERLSNGSQRAEMEIDFSDPHEPMMNTNESASQYTPPPEPHHYLTQMPDTLTPLLGTIIPITLSPSAPTFDHPFNPITNLAISSPSPIIIEGPMHDMVPTADMVEWNQAPNDQYAYAQGDRVSIVSQTGTISPFDSSSSYNFTPRPRQGPQMFSHPGD